MKDMRKAWEWTLIGVGLFVILKTLHPTVGGDGALRFASVEALMDGGSAFAKYSLVQAILSLPLAWFADLKGADRAALVAWFNLLVFCIFAIFIYRELAIRYSSRIGRVWFLLMMSGSMFPHHLQNYYGEVLTSLCVFLAVLLVSRLPVAAVLLFAVGCANTPALLLPLTGLALVWFLLDRKIAPMMAVVVAVAFVGLDMWFKQAGAGQSYLSDAEHGFHSVLPYSGRAGFSYPVLLGVLSITLSLGKGLVFFIPALFLGFSSRIRQDAGLNRKATILAVVALLLPVLIYSKWWAWYGGSFWGPRFFLFMCAPTSLLLTLGLLSNNRIGAGPFIVLLVLLLSAWVSLDGYLFGQDDMDACWDNNFSQEYLCWYAPEFSALWRPFITGKAWHLHQNARWLYAVWEFIVVVYLGSLLLVPLARAKWEALHGGSILDDKRRAIG